MAILKIARMGHPVLKRRAAYVDDPTRPEIAQLVEDMIETMHDAGGTGLAAPQVHVPLRIVIFTVFPDRDRAEGGAGEGIPLTVLINPEIENLGAEEEFGWEGCLSIPGMMGEVPRFTHIRYSAYDLDGERHVREAKGFHARVVQHECDHLDGILYPQRIEDMSSFGFTEELTRQGGHHRPEEDEEE